MFLRNIRRFILALAQVVVNVHQDEKARFDTRYPNIHDIPNVMFSMDSFVPRDDPTKLLYISVRQIFRDRTKYVLHVKNNSHPLDAYRTFNYSACAVCLH